MLNRVQLKWIAVISMLLDHVGAVFFPEILWFRIVGRLSFPIYAYCLAEGFFFTANFEKYFFRLAALAFLSQIPFNLVFYGTPFSGTSLNIFFTLALGLLFLKVTQGYCGQTGYGAAAAFAFGLAAEFFHMNYGMGGIWIIFSFYLILQKRWEKVGWCIFVLTNIFWFWGGVQWAALFAVIPLGLYDKLPAKRKQRFFYWIYPLHLLLLWIVAKYMGIR